MPGQEEKIAEAFVAKHTELAMAAPFHDLKPFVDSLQSPRKIING